MKKILAAALTVALFAGACAEATNTQKGAGWGAAIGTVAGAGLGAAIGGKKGALIGAGTGLVVGGLAGGAIGRYMDNQERDMRNAMAQLEGASIKRDQDILELTFKSDVMFATGSSVLQPGAYGEIDRVCQVLNKYPQCRIRIEGHTDSVGSEDYNLNLSQQRAESVRNALIQRNVDPARLQAVGMGKGQPIASNDNEGGRQMNRRVTMKIIPIEAQGQQG